MKALRIYSPGNLAGIKYEEIPTPEPAAGEVLVKVYASGLSPLEITWSTSTGQLRPLPNTLGYELSGVVAALGKGVSGLRVGDEVYGLPDFKMGGTQAEYVVVRAEELAPKPASLSHVEASTVPLSALTAWQCLFDQAQILPGQTVLVHGAAGGVGIFAVQLAHWAGAKVLATASAKNQSFLEGLGVDQVIDYNLTAFEDAVHEIDVVFDTVGGDTLARSWKVLKKGGYLVSIANVSPEELQIKARVWGVRAAWVLVKPSRAELVQISELLDSGKLKSQISSVFPLSQGRLAYEEGLKGHNRGKMVLQVVN